MTQVISIDAFTQDAPWAGAPVSGDLVIENQIDGVRLQPIKLRGYHEGHLAELLSVRGDKSVTIPHVYRVNAKPGSVRGWVYHKWQHDRLAFTEGDFLFVLHDIRPDSPTYGAWNEVSVGVDRPALLTIPPYVVHGVKNRGVQASFVNLPTNYYDPANPDKFRVRYPDPRLPYEFA